MASNEAHEWILAVSVDFPSNMKKALEKIQRIGGTVLREFESDAKAIFSISDQYFHRLYSLKGVERIFLFLHQEKIHPSHPFLDPSTDSYNPWLTTIQNKLPPLILQHKALFSLSSHSEIPWSLSFKRKAGKTTPLYKHFKKDLFFTELKAFLQNELSQSTSIDSSSQSNNTLYHYVPLQGDPLLTIYTIVSTERIFMMLPLLKRNAHQISSFQFAKKGIHHTLSYAINKIAKLSSSDIVFDCCCGKGMLLLESHVYHRSFLNAKHSEEKTKSLEEGGVEDRRVSERKEREKREECLVGRGGFFIGSDIDAKQLTDFQSNLRSTQCSAADMVLGSVGSGMWRGGYVDVLMSDLPFGVQIGDMESNRELYPGVVAQASKMTHERSRVLLLVSLEGKKLMEPYFFGGEAEREGVVFFGGVNCFIGAIPCCLLLGGHVSSMKGSIDEKGKKAEEHLDELFDLAFVRKELAGKSLYKMMFDYSVESCIDWKHLKPNLILCK